VPVSFPCPSARAVIRFHFSDPWNPRPEEIRSWAYDADAGEPVEDFDLALTTAGHEAVYLDLAADSACPHRRYFLHVLYLKVGDDVRSGYASTPEAAVRAFVGQGASSTNPDVRAWAERSRALMADPSLFDFASWCERGFAAEGAAPLPMSPDDQRALVDRYLAAYNAFDVDGMVALLHPEIVFENVAGGEVTHTTEGVDAFRALAEASKGFFSSRRQTVTAFTADGATALADIAYEGVLAADLPNGMTAGETLALTGHSTFVFCDGLFYRITDAS